MEPLRLFLALSVFAAVVLHTQAAPTSDLYGPPGTLEDDTDVNPGEDRSSHDVTTDERYYRVNEDGSIEFKTALSNGHIQYQRITNKVVDGRTIQVYEGYTSQRFADGRYGTSYYIADENGYRRTKVETDTKPPTLPRSGPYSPELTKTNERLPETGRSVPPKPVDESIPEARSEETDLPATEEDLYIAKDVKRHTVYDTALPKHEDERSNEVFPAAVNEVEAQSTTEAPVEESAVKVSENEELPVLPNSDHSANEVVPTVTEENRIPALPVTEEGVGKASEDSPVLPLEQDTKKEIPVTTEGSIRQDLPASPEENEVNVEDHVHTPEEQVPTTEENLATEAPALWSTTVAIVQVSTEAVNEDLPTFTEENLSTEVPKLAVTEEDIVKVSEENLEKSAEEDKNEDIPLTTEQSVNTEIPTLSTTEESAPKVVEVKLEESSVLLTAEQDTNEELPITSDESANTEVPTPVVTEESIVKTAEEDLEDATGLPTTEHDDAATTTDTPLLSTTEENIVKNTEEDLEESSGLPTTEQASNEEESVSTEAPALWSTEEVSEETVLATTEKDTNEEATISKAKSVDTEVPELPATEGSIVKLSEDNYEESVLPTSESIEELPATETSTNLPALVTGAILTNGYFDESSGKSSEVLPTTEQTATETEDESSTANHTYAEEKITTEVPSQPEENVSVSLADDIEVNEISNESTDDKNLDAVTELPEQSSTADHASGLFEDSQKDITTSQPDTLGEDRDVSTELPALSTSEINLGRALEEEATSTVLPTHLSEHDHSTYKRDDPSVLLGTTHEDADENETAAPAVSPVTQSSEDKSLEEISTDDIKKESSTELPLSEENDISTHVPALLSPEVNETKTLEGDLLALENSKGSLKISDEPSTENKTSEEDQSKSDESHESTEHPQSSSEEERQQRSSEEEYFADIKEVAPPTTAEENEYKTGERDDVPVVDATASVIRV